MQFDRTESHALARRDPALGASDRVVADVVPAPRGEEEAMRPVLVSSMTRAAAPRRLLRLAAFLAFVLLPVPSSALNAIQNPSFELFNDTSWTGWNAVTRAGAGGVSGHTG